MAETPIPVPLPGDLVWIRQRRWRVRRALRDGQAVRVDVSSGARNRTFLAPFDVVTPATRETRRFRKVRAQRALASTAGALAACPDVRLPLALLDADVDILPHQLEPVLAILAGHCRLLIADAVGLGKTIEAGLIIAELVRREPAPRILVLAPSLVRDQWRTELGRRFAIETFHGDRAGLESIARAGAFGANPWKRSGVWLASPDFLKQAPVLSSVPRDPWDLLVIDEAHTVCGDSDRYEACQLMARRSRRVVLLTATPHSGEEARFDRLETLGRTSDADEPPILFRRTRRDLGYAQTRRVRWHGVALKHHEHATLAELMAFEQAAVKTADDIPAACLVLSVFRKRALSSFAALSRSLSRRLTWIGAEPLDLWQQPALDLGDHDDEEPDDSDALRMQIGLDRNTERVWLERLRDMADLAACSDSKIARLAHLVARTAEPVVVFSEFRDSLLAIQQRLRSSRSISLIHGAQSMQERSGELARYLAGSASILLSTDVAGQGLNLQSRGRWVVSLELPWNPVRLEQRIGRVDRLGQMKNPHFTVLVAKHEAETGLLQQLARRVLLAQQRVSPDVLEDVIPPETEVGASLFTGEGRALSVAPMSRPKLLRTNRWQRAGGVVARACERRRRLARCWLGSHTDTASPVQAWLPPHHGLSSASRSLVICVVALLNGDRELVERVPVALLVPRELVGERPERLLDHCIHPLAAKAVRRRLRKAARWLSESVRTRPGREVAVLNCSRSDHRSRQAQPGLFDNRVLKQLESVSEDDERLERRAMLHLSSIADAATLSVGPIEIIAVLNSRQ